MRRRQHYRRANTFLGVATVDLSGPHEPTPRPGAPIANHACHYFLVMSVRPDTTMAKQDAQVQTSGPEAASDVVVAVSGTPGEAKPLVYVALLGRTDEAPSAVMHLQAQARNQHAHLPMEVVFRLHSDQGGANS